MQGSPFSFRLAFLASGNGTSMRAIHSACREGQLASQPVLLVSNRRTSPALAFATEVGIDSLLLPTAADPEDADRRLCAALTSAGIDLVILSGYLRRLGPFTLQGFAGRILNIHPSLLPAHGGAGMYGRRVHEAVLAAGDTHSGATVHLVDADYDSGIILARQSVPVRTTDTPESLEGRIAEIEPALFVATLKRIETGQIILQQEARSMI